MTTPAQISANQQNAQFSTGPRTESGKAVSSQNGVSHGLSSTFAVLAHENQSEFDALLQTLCDEFAPDGANQQFLVAEMAQARWKMQRIDRLETLALDLVILGEESSGDSPDARIIAAFSKNDRDPLPLLNRYRCTAERSYYKALARLQQDRREKIKSEEQALDNYIKNTIYAPLPGAVDPLRNVAPQTNAPAAGPNGFASQNPSVTPAESARPGAAADSTLPNRRST
jgi:hypothetical protein